MFYGELFMDVTTLKEVLACLDDSRRLFHYHKDKYALYLIGAAIGSKIEIDIDKIRTSHLSKLLQKDIVNAVMSHCGNGKITTDKLEVYIQDYESYVITLSEWGDKSMYPREQTSRPGANLVLQLNLTGEHDQFMEQLKIDADVFKFYGHPIHNSKSSVAWARIDLDFDAGEALIEEIQNDWLRKAYRHNRLSKRAITLGMDKYQNYEGVFNSNNMLEYTTKVIKKYAKTWSETMMFSTIQFIKEELGIGKIFYHSVDTGRCLKNIAYQFPPTSIYKDLPRKFCFQETQQAPSFISSSNASKRRLKKIRHARWYYLEI